VAVNNEGEQYHSPRGIDKLGQNVGLSLVIADPGGESVMNSDQSTMPVVDAAKLAIWACWSERGRPSTIRSRSTGW
jgi:hypothetical protein